MFIIYLLLSIIALGVLVLSDIGRKILWVILITMGAALLLCIIGYVIFLLFLDEAREILGGIFLVLFMGVTLYTLYTKIRDGKLSFKIIKNKTVSAWNENWNEGLGTKIAMVFVVISFTGIFLFMIYSFFINAEGKEIKNCPEDYKTQKEADAEIDSFISVIIAAHPNATVEEIGKARLDYLEINHCTETLNSIEKRGGKTAYIESLKSQMAQ